MIAQSSNKQVRRGLSLSARKKFAKGNSQINNAGAIAVGLAAASLELLGADVALDQVLGTGFGEGKHVRGERLRAAMPATAYARGSSEERIWIGSVPRTSAGSDFS